MFEKNNLFIFFTGLLFFFTESGDSTEIQGTWIGVWQKRDGDWKITMNTFHLKEDE